ncbi:MAG TPA: bifunctional methylenetetrahydrofolate dehydrogenase/methenyltetrahydrofolate cyclohydrolase FolD [Bacteroidetes bacterium]|nr:bifunctional methylenetetrahydrofolate dehydrogenase/methenyltetrahydrofolate cyclohydrolase FolD [Bacteroidota bacterium]
MSAKIIDGKQIANQIREELKAEVEELKSAGITPGLAVVLVGEDPASQVYVRRKEKIALELGFYSLTLRYPQTMTQEELLASIHRLNEDAKIHGILVQLPLPDHIDANLVIETIDPKKDVDGFHPKNVGALMLGKPIFVPCTPAGIMLLLQRAGIDPAGKHAVILGRSNIVGKPMMNLLMQKQKGANATVTICHTGTKDFTVYTKQADILIAAMGKAAVVIGDMLKPGVVVIDVGVNRMDDLSRKSGYRLAGDVDFTSAAEVASMITPVPGGVGPMTIIMLMKNTVRAAKRVRR